MDAVEDRAASPRVWKAADSAHWVSAPGADSDKYSRGVLGVITGSARFPGAAVLGVEAAARTGVGMVRYLGDAAAAQFVLQRRPETVTAAGRVQAWLAGSGMDADARSRQETEQVHAALASGEPVVLDAGALDLVGEATGPTVITPHCRELARVLSAVGEGVDAEGIAAEPGRWAARAAELAGVVVLLKGASTRVVAPSGAAAIVHSDCPWLATAGTGDVLGGILGALLATHADALAGSAPDTDHALVALAATAASIHSAAAIRASAGGPIAALDVAEAVPATVAALLAL